MATVKDLKNKTKQFGRNPQSYPKLGVSKVEISPSIGVKTIRFSAAVKGKAKPFYRVGILFTNVEYTTERQEGPSWRRISFNNQVYYYKVPAMDNNNCKVYCQCKDFTFRFSKQDFDAKALIGNWTRYDARKSSPGKDQYYKVEGRWRVTQHPDKGGLPFVNPGDIPGICKHLYNFILQLKKKDFLY